MKRLVISLIICVLALCSIFTLGYASDDAVVYADSDAVTIDDTSYIDNHISIDNDVVIFNDTNRRIVYLGGKPLGIDVKSNGLVISGLKDVITDKGAISPCKDIDIKVGDLLISVDGERVLSESDVVNNVGNKDSVTLEIDRNGVVKEYYVETARDVLTGSKKLGLWLKDGITGIGTLTYIDGNTRRYGALGHPIEEGKSYRSGALYNANINGYIKGQKGKAGELDGTILGGKQIGTIDKNTTYGIFGTYVGDLDGFETIEVANRSEIRPGKAQIYTTIEGGTPKYYDIEIIKKVSQSKPHNKGLVIRITDKELLDKSNGILQGMSGSPIIQNGRLVGAVTHVFINDPTKGFGMYIDFMLDN